MQPATSDSPESSPVASAPAGESAPPAATAEERSVPLAGSLRGVLFAAILIGTAVAYVVRGVMFPYSGGLPFNAPLFLGFFLWFFTLYHFVAATKNQKLWLLSLGSLMFYGSWGIQFVPLVLATGLLDFWLARKIAAEPDKAKKRR